MPHASLCSGLAGLLLTLLLPTLPAVAQQPTDSLRAEALQDFHGSDLTGKDGPLAKAGLDLLMLYHEYQAFQRRVVSGRLPIGQVPEMARLESLRGVALSQMQTQGNGSSPTPSEMIPKTPGDAASPPTDAGEPSSEEAPAGESGAFAFLLSVLGLLLLTEL